MKLQEKTFLSGWFTKDQYHPTKRSRSRVPKEIPTLFANTQRQVSYLAPVPHTSIGANVSIQPSLSESEKTKY